MDVYPARRRRVLRTLRREAVDALLVSDPANVRYLTGFTGEDTWLVLGRREEVMVSDGRYETQLQQECPDLQLAIRSPGTPLPQAVAEVLHQARYTRVGYDPNHLSVAQFHALTEACPLCQWVALCGVVERFRARKDPAEIAAVRRAVEIAQRAFQATVALLGGQRCEEEIAGELEAAIRRLGGQGCSFTPIVAVGPRAALPHATLSSTRVEEAPVLLIDWGARWNGYCSDLTRTLITGRLTRKVAQAYQAVYQAQQAALEAIAPGVPCQQVHQAAQSVLEQAGLGKYFTHSLGHGVGLRVHELPRLGPGSSTVLEPGMIVTVEPGVYLPGRFGIRLEDDVLVTRQGAELLSSLPRELEALCVKVA